MLEVFLIFSFIYVLLNPAENNERIIVTRVTIGTMAETPVRVTFINSDMFNLSWK